jgi:hypothetical protein
LYLKNGRFIVIFFINGHYNCEKKDIHHNKID